MTTKDTAKELFGETTTVNYDLDKAKETIEAKLNQAWIKQREVGKTKLSYIGGQTVIRLLNKAFNYQWSFEIVSEEVRESLTKIDKWGKKPPEPQPPVAKVLGRLIVPGLGIKEQYGSKILIGGATEQESAFKSAATDALKKCASLFGIGLELYGEDEGMYDEDEAPTEVAPPQQAPQQQTPPQQAPPVQQQAPVQTEQAPVQHASNMAVDPNVWQQKDIDRLKELKQILGITDNVQLDPYVREFLDHPEMTYYDVTPLNVQAFNVFLTKKAQNL